MPLCNARSNEVFTYWDSLRAGRGAPSRLQIDPGALRHRLPDLFMLDWLGTQLKFRLAGTRICELFGRELRDTRFLALWTQPSRDQVNEAAIAALRMEEAVIVKILLTSDADAIEFEMLLLPLRSTTGVVDRLLGCLMPLTTGPIVTSLPGASLTLLRWTPAGSASEGDEQTASVASTSLLHRLLPGRLGAIARQTWRG